MELPQSPVSNKYSVRYLDSIDVNKIINLYQEKGIDVKRFFKNINQIQILKCSKTGYRFYYPFSCIGDAKFYAELSKGRSNYYSSRWEHDVALQYISKNNKVLEIGSGFGAFLKKLRSANIDGIGLELNTHAVEVCKNQNLHVLSDNYQEFAEKHSGGFDVVCSFQVLEHIPEVDSFFRAARKLLKKGGRLIVGVPNNNPYLFITDKYHTLNLPPHHVGLWNKTSLKKVGKEHSLKTCSTVFEPLTENYRYFFSVNLNKIKSKLLKKIIGKLEVMAPQLAHNIICYFFKGRNILITYKK